jgi:hypothetical protein
VYVALGGVEVGPGPSGLDEKEREEHDRKVVENRRRSELANIALDYLRLEEALGRPPTLKEIGRSGFEFRAEEVGLGSDVEESWLLYERVVREALAGKSPNRPAPSSKKRATREQSRRPAPEVTLEGDEGVREPSEEGASKSGASAQSETLAAPKKPWWRRLLDR